MHKADAHNDAVLIALRQSFHDIANHLNTISMQAELAKMFAQEHGMETETLDAILSACRASGLLTRASEVCASPGSGENELEHLQSLVKKGS